MWVQTEPSTNKSNNNISPIKESNLSKKQLFLLRTIIPFFSLATTFLLLFFLYIELQLYLAGDHSNTRLFLILFFSLSLFLIPFLFNPKSFKKYITRPKPIQSNEKRFQLKIFKRIKLNTHYSRHIFRKCPKCRFENPSNTKMCFNCGFSLDQL